MAVFGLKCKVFAGQCILFSSGCNIESFISLEIYYWMIFLITPYFYRDISWAQIFEAFHTDLLNAVNFTWNWSTCGHALKAGKAKLQKCRTRLMYWILQSRYFPDLIAKKKKRRVCLDDNRSLWKILRLVVALATSSERSSCIRS